MAYVSIFSKRSQGFGDKPSGGNNWLQFDTVISEAHAHATRVTSSPVQNGAEVANNAVNDPSEVIIVGVVTDTPFLLSIANKYSDAIGITGTSDSTDSYAQSRSQAATTHLLEVKNKRELLTVDTTLLRYENMLLTGVSCETNKDTYYAPVFTLTFKEVIIPVEDTVTSDGNTNYGSVSTTNPSNSSALSITSVLKNILSGGV